MIKALILSAVVLNFAGCLTTTKSALRENEDFQVRSEKKIYVELESGFHDEIKELFSNALINSGIKQSNVTFNYPTPKQYIPDGSLKTVDDFFPIQIPDQASDLRMKLVFKSYGYYYISLCPSLLGIVPCLPSFQWVVGARVSDKTNTFKKDYLIKEDVNGVVWLPYFSPNLWKGNFIPKQIMDRMVKNLLLQMSEDKIL